MRIRKLSIEKGQRPAAASCSIYHMSHRPSVNSFENKNSTEFLDHSGLKLLPLRSFDVHAESLPVDCDYKLKEKILKIKENAIIFEPVVSIVTLD